MTNRTALIALRDAVVEGKWDHSPAGVARQVFPYRSASIDDLGLTAAEAFNGSMDSSIELVCAAIPGAGIDLEIRHGLSDATIYPPEYLYGNSGRYFTGTNKDPARALLIATLNAMIEGGADDRT